MDKINFEDWKKIEMRVGKILTVERIPKSNNLYKLQVNIGQEKTVQIVTGLVPYYTEDELKDRKIIVLVNLEPAKFRGEVSEAMLLCATDDDNDKCVLLTLEKDIEEGTLIT